MKNYILITLLICLIASGCSGNKKNENRDSIETITIDIRKAHMEYDITSMIDTSYFEIIPLETNDECLIAEIKNIYLANNKIVIYDRAAKGAYIFNRDGSYHAKVRALGQGRGEYLDVNDIYASDNYINVLTPPRLMLYDYDGKYVKTISLEDRSGQNIFTFDELNYYLVNSWGDSFKPSVVKGNYHLFHFDTKQNRVESYLLYPKQYIGRRGWGLEKQYNKYEDKALIYISSIDTIYCLTPPNEITPRYAIDIVYNKLPDVLRTGDGLTAILSAQKNDYVMGVNNITETSRYLFLKLDAGKHVIYDKKEKETKVIAQHFRIAPFWNIGINVNFGLNKGDYIIYHTPGYSAFNAIEDIPKARKRGNGVNPFEKKFFEVLENMKDEEDNPIVFIFKVKD